METIVKAFLGVFFTLTICCLGIGIIRASTDARNADASLAAYAERIGCSNYAPDVVEACIEDARDEGYDLDVRLIQPDDRDSASHAALSLRYHFRVPLIMIDSIKTISADV